MLSKSLQLLSVLLNSTSPALLTSADEGLPHRHRCGKVCIKDARYNDGTAAWVHLVNLLSCSDELWEALGERLAAAIVRQLVAEPCSPKPKHAGIQLLLLVHQPSAGSMA